MWTINYFFKKSDKLRKNAIDTELSLSDNENSVIDKYQNSNVIDRVYSNSLGGLIGQRIKASAINGISNAFARSGMRKELKEIGEEKNKFQNSFDKGLYKIASIRIDKLVASIYNRMIQIYSDIGIICDYQKYPLNDYNFDNVITLVEDETKMQSEKVVALNDAIKNDPVNYLIYQLCIDNLVFEKKSSFDFNELLRFTGTIDFLTDDQDNCVHYSMDGTKCELLMIDDIQFLSLYEKECYLSDKNNYLDVLSRFLNERQWFNLDKVTSNYNEIINGEPKSEVYKNLFSVAEAAYKIIQEIHTDFIDFTLDALNEIESDFTVKDIFEQLTINLKNAESDEKNRQSNNLWKDEVVIKYYKYGSLGSFTNSSYSHAHGLMITNMRMALTYSGSSEIFYSFFPSKEYVESFVPTNDSALWRSPAEINFTHNVYYNYPSTWFEYGTRFYTDIGALDRKSEEFNVIDKFTSFYNTLQEKYVNRSFDVSNYKISDELFSKPENIFTVPYTVVLNNMEEIDTSTDIFRKWYDNYAKCISEYTNFIIDINDKIHQAINDEQTHKEIEEYQGLIKKYYPEYYDDRINFLDNQALANKNDDCRKAFQILEDLSNKIDDKDVLFDLGMAYCYGFGTDINYQKAKKIFSRIKFQIPDAGYHLSWIYSNDDSLFPDDYDWNSAIIDAASRGSNQAMVRFCIWERNESHGFIKNGKSDDTANKLLNILSEKGNRVAKRLIASQYYNNSQQATYDETIQELLNIIATHTKYDWIDLGIVYKYLYFYYEQGLVVKKDMQKAIYYCELAAKNDNAMCQRYLGEYYLKGHYVQKDKKKAQYWFIKSAKQEDSKSLSYLRKYFKDIDINNLSSENIDSVDFEQDDLYVTCPKCGKKIKSTAKFCNFCGAKYSADSEQNDLYVTCQKCGKKIKSTSKFCNFCGAKQ